MLGATDKERGAGRAGQGLDRAPGSSTDRAGHEGCLGPPILGYQTGYGASQSWPSKETSVRNQCVTLKGHGDPDQGVETD